MNKKIALKLGCVLQGDLRVPLGPILEQISPKFDVVVLSTWKEDRAKCPAGDYELILNERPKIGGATNRNLQRYTTARGIDVLAGFGCTHVLKWRTDMLPTRLDTVELLRLCSHGADNEFGGRIVTGCFRHLSVSPDWFSSFPDQYSFSTLEAARHLWSDEDFSYDRMFNMPLRMRDDLGISDGPTSDTFIYRGNRHHLLDKWSYDPHTELYALFKNRIERTYGLTLTHPQIIRKYFKLIRDDHLGICWFKSPNTGFFRPIRRGYHLKWWRGTDGFTPTIYPLEELQVSPAMNFAARAFWAVPIRYEMAKQALAYLRYKAALALKTKLRQEYRP